MLTGWLRKSNLTKTHLQVPGLSKSMKTRFCSVRTLLPLVSEVSFCSLGYPGEAAGEHYKKFPQSHSGLSISIGSEKGHRHISDLLFHRLLYNWNLLDTFQMSVRWQNYNTPVPVIDSKLPINICGTFLIISLKKSCDIALDIPETKVESQDWQMDYFLQAICSAYHCRKLRECNTIGLYNNYFKSPYSLEDMSSLL